MDKNPDVRVAVNDSVVSMTTPEHKELTKENLSELADEVIAKKEEIKEAIGDNWFPCGFAKLHISGNSGFVRFIKKEGRETRNGYELGDIRITKDNYGGGYNIHLDYGAHGPMEGQSLNFKRPLYSLLQDGLAFLGVSTQLRSRMD